MSFNRIILDQDISIALKKHGGFFAFCNDTFKKELNPKLKYVSLGAGLYAPKKTYKKMLVDIDQASRRHVKRDLSINTIKDVIWRELANFECQINGDISACVDALKPYGITKDQIVNEYNDYYNYCVDNDLF